MVINAWSKVHYKGTRRILYSFARRSEGDGSSDASQTDCEDLIENADPTALLKSAVSLLERRKYPNIEFPPEHSIYSPRLEFQKEIVAPVIQAFNTILGKIMDDTRRLHLQEIPKIAEIKNVSVDSLSANPDMISDSIVALLKHSSFPFFEFERKVEVELNKDTGLVLVEYNLPRRNDLPFVKKLKFVAAFPGRIEEKHLSEKELDALFDDVVYSLILFSMNCIYSNIPGEQVKAIVFNGYIEDVDKATGHQKRGCIVSIQCTREAFNGINLEQVDPKACFRHLKGIGSSKLYSVTPIPPMMNIAREDRRFVESYPVAHMLDAGSNIAAMDWLDFENFIRELFEKEFSQNGGEVKITQSSRDGGVDAVAFDPDPIRGGKIIIQAKRYTNTVGVSAVRDLYGTLINEGATKGLLVTTSDYGPDAYEFVKGKPITLLNGGHLLALLSKHGQKARISLSEAKKELAEKEARERR